MLNNMIDLDHVFHALADPTRRAIIVRLGRGAMPVSELAKPLPMTLAAVGQHIQVLERSGLVKTHKTGRTRFCSLDEKAVAAAEAWLSARRQMWNTHFDRLEELLEADARSNVQLKENDP